MKYLRIHGERTAGEGGWTEKEWKSILIIINLFVRKQPEQIFKNNLRAIEKRFYSDLKEIPWGVVGRGFLKRFIERGLDRLKTVGVRWDIEGSILTEPSYSRLMFETCSRPFQNRNLLNLFSFACVTNHNTLCGRWKQALERKK
jgi:hypothetical protein